MSNAMGEAVLGRLEAVVSRLESFENRLSAGGGGPPPRSSVSPAAPTAQGNGAQAPAAAAASTGSGAESVAAYDAFIAAEVSSLEKAGNAIGGGVEEVTQILKRAFVAERAVVAAMASCKKPTDSEFQGLIAPVAKEMEAAQAKTSGRRTAEDMHFKMVAEAMGGLSWVCHQPGIGMSVPPLHIDEALQGADFYANKVLMEHRHSNPAQVEWVKAVKAAFAGLRTYAKKFHGQGPVWNASGVPLASFGGAPAAATAAAKGRGGPPPAAPPPPPPGFMDDLKKPGGAGAEPDGMAAVFSQLKTSGDGVTSGLRKVTDDMKAKNRSDRSGHVSTGAAAPKPAARKPAALAAAASKPPVFELQNHRKWAVENHRDNRSIVIEETDPRQSVYVYNCEGCTIQIKGKVNAISIDSCKKTGLVFDDVVASFEAVNSKSLQLQVMGHCATFSVDKCDGLQLYLSRDSMGAEIISAKSSELNILTPGKTDEDEMAEHPLPEQFVSRLEGGKFVTFPVCHSAG